jgi:hypothetical protein
LQAAVSCLRFCWRQARTVKSPWSITFRARHQPDFEWQAERESYTVKPAEEYAEDCDQPSLAASGAAAGQDPRRYRHRPWRRSGPMPAIKRLPKRRILGCSCRPTPFMRTLRWSFAGAATERVRVRGVLTRGTTITFSHRLATASRPLPAEPSEAKGHVDRACGRTHPCRSEA